VNGELEQKLFLKYRDLFAGRSQPLTQSLMGFGFECDDGWYDLIDTLCEQIVQCDAEFRKKHPDAPPLRATQVKEKYGTLSFYVGPAAETVLDLTEFAEALSAKICETCGNKGRTRNKKSWLKTLCDQCAREQGYPVDERP
jgi:hypothetical protein